MMPRGERKVREDEDEEGSFGREVPTYRFQ